MGNLIAALEKLIEINLYQKKNLQNLPLDNYYTANACRIHREATPLLLEAYRQRAQGYLDKEPDESTLPPAREFHDALLRIAENCGRTLRRIKFDIDLEELKKSEIEP